MEYQAGRELTPCTVFGGALNQCWGLCHLQFEASGHLSYDQGRGKREQDDNLASRLADCQTTLIA